jgi:hypothetical protein
MVIFNKKKTLTTEYKTFSQENSCILTFPECFKFAIPDEPKKPAGTIEIRLQERGLPKKEKKLRKGLYYSFLCCPLRFTINMIRCIIKYTLLLPCTLLWGIMQSALRITTWTVDKTLTAAGAFTTLAATKPIKIQELAGDGEGATTVSLVHYQEYQKQASCSSRGKPRTISISVKFLWSLPDYDRVADKSLSNLLQSIPLVFYGKKGKTNYTAVRSDELLKAEELETALALIKDCYSVDKIGPRTTSSVDAPPVKRVRAIYGVNLPTEVGAVYRRTNLVPAEGCVQGLHELDASVRLSANPGYNVKGGIIYEDKSTPQTLHGSNECIYRSGDGTVPYWSLQHCRSWQGPCDVTVDEIEGAEHREILGDKRFHSILIDYVTEQV